jgi:hypothetical protein
MLLRSLVEGSEGSEKHLRYFIFKKYLNFHEQTGTCGGDLGGKEHYSRH